MSESKREKLYHLWHPVIGEDGEQEYEEWYGRHFECPLCGFLMIGESTYCGGCGTKLLVEVELE